MPSALLDKLLADIKTAMKERQAETLTTLRSLHAQVKDATTNAGKEETDELVASVVSRAIKQRRDAVEQFRQGSREDLAEKEQREIELITRYQPEQLSDEALDEYIRTAISESGAGGAEEMGKVMKLLMPRVKGRVDGRRVKERTQALLGA